VDGITFSFDDCDDIHAPEKQYLKFPRRFASEEIDKCFWLVVPDYKVGANEYIYDGATNQHVELFLQVLRFSFTAYRGSECCNYIQ